MKLLVIYFYLLYIYLISFFLTLTFRSLMKISQGTKQLTISLLSFLAVLCLGCYLRAFSICDEWELLFAAMHRLLTVVASLIAELPALEHGDLRSCGSIVVTHRLSCSVACGTLPGQGLNPCPLHWQVDS